jgi:hypothetical protein
VSSPEESALRAEIERALGNIEGMDVDTLVKYAETLRDNRASTVIRHRSAETVRKLVALCAEFHAPRSIEPGDIVRWKMGLKNKVEPEYDQPGILIELYDPPRRDMEQPAGSQYFRESLDALIGYVGTDDANRERFYTFHFDSRRFERHPAFQDEADPA